MLQGALLLVLFQTSHALEHLLTAKAQGNLAALYDAMPKEATLVATAGDGSPDLTTARRVRAADVDAGDCMLVKPGEQVRRRVARPARVPPPCVFRASPLVYAALPIP